MGRFASQSTVMSIFVWFFADTLKQATCLFWIRLRASSSIISSSVKAPSMSLLFPRINKGMLSRDGHSSSSCSCLRASSITERSTASTTYIITSDYLQYFSQDSLNRCYPPKSQTFNYTFPFFILLKLNPIVGIVSSSKPPCARVPVSVDFPAF